MGKKSVRNRRKKVLIATVAVFVMLFVLISGIWAYKAITVAQLREVAYEFIPDSSWTKVGEYSAEPEIITCLDSACPMYEIVWDTKELVTPQQFKDILVRMRWPDDVFGDCLPAERSSGRRVACSAEFDRHGYHMAISYKNDSGNASYHTISLRVTN